MMSKFGASVNGYYKVGHSAIVLINRETGVCHYFGRYQTSVNLGRARDCTSDKDLAINTCIEFSADGLPNKYSGIIP